MKTWRMTGSICFTDSPRPELSTGTSRQPSRTWPSSLIARSISYSQARRDAGSFGRNTMPTPYWPSGGRRTPCAIISSRKNASGICRRMPAPSPASGSAPTAPRWVRFLQDQQPLLDDRVAFRPLMLATKPTPQASCSLAGSYSPWGRGRPDPFTGFSKKPQKATAQAVGRPVVALRQARCQTGSETR